MTNKPPTDTLLEECARAICNSTEAEEYDDYSDRSIMKAVYRQQAKACIDIIEKRENERVKGITNLIDKILEEGKDREAEAFEANPYDPSYDVEITQAIASVCTLQTLKIRIKLLTNNEGE